MMTTQAEIINICQDIQARKVYLTDKHTYLQLNETMTLISDKFNTTLIELLSNFVNKYPGNYPIDITFTLPRLVKQISLNFCYLSSQNNDEVKIKAWYFSANKENAISTQSPNHALNTLFQKIKLSQYLTSVAYFGFIAEDWFDFSQY